MLARQVTLRLLVSIHITNLAHRKMGIIDTTKIKITCPKCNVTEYISIHQKGSIYNPYWQEGVEAASFALTWVGGNKEETSITSAKCKGCGFEAILNIIA